ncbi:GNAT family N-acetyltransferase [Aerophototrophica crusticola]|uniref:GNAT family N-acetyltransferase n=1 Tax=Aerophototrophica crusticola TaxID=1709002 RepID=A0A858R4Z9_9PROT|nr:GNAT family N-acetyltransferase [Rhodospirillaceae bacterium B3]
MDGLWRCGSLDRLTLSLDVVIRPCGPQDLEGLEWSGAFRDQRDLFQAIHQRQHLGEVDMLVAAVGDVPVGQAWADYRPAAAGKLPMVWGLRVQPAFRRKGIAARLLGALEGLAMGRGHTGLSLEVEETNLTARRLYARLGYLTVPKHWDRVAPTIRSSGGRRILLEKRLAGAAQLSAGMAAHG